MQNIKEYNFSNKKVLVRVDFNVPLNDNLEVTDNTRLMSALPTIRKIVEGGGIPILMSHLGRPKEKEPQFSLQHIVSELESLLGLTINFVADCIGEVVTKTVEEAQTGDVILLENLRYYSEEKKGDIDFARNLASLADTYVNDAFGTAHRAHASTAVIAQFFPKDKMFGLLLQSEIESLEKVVGNPNKPVTAIIGGAKVSSKIGVLENLLEKVDNIIIGGGMAFTFVKAQGGKVGASLVEEDKLDTALELLEQAKKANVNICLPTDSIIADKFDNDAERKSCKINEIPDNWMGLDIGASSIAKMQEVIKNSSTLLWNGPMGVFEFSNFQNGTVQLGEAICAATLSGAYSLVGGGDSVAAVNQFGMADKVSYISTGGGAMLEYLEGKKLPGIKAMLE